MARRSHTCHCGDYSCCLACECEKLEKERDEANLAATMTVGALQEALRERDEARRYANELEARCEWRDEELAEAREVASEMWGHAQTYAGGEEGCTVEYLNDQARVYPWLTERGE